MFSAEIPSVASGIAILWRGSEHSHKARFLGRCSEFCGEPVACRRKKRGKHTTTDRKPVLVRDCGDTGGSERDQQVQSTKIPNLMAGCWDEGGKPQT